MLAGCLYFKEATCGLSQLEADRAVDPPREPNRVARHPHYRPRDPFLWAALALLLDDGRALGAGDFPQWDLQERGTTEQEPLGAHATLVTDYAYQVEAWQRVLNAEREERGQHGHDLQASR